MITRTLILCFMLLLLSGCGKRGELKPPVTADEKASETKMDQQD